MKKLLLSSILLISLIGCDQVKQEKWQPENFADAKVLADSMSEVSKSDLEVIYKQFSGLTECLRNCDGCFRDTLDIDSAIGTFHSKYGYSPGNYKNFNETFLTYMKNKGYNTEEDTRTIVDYVKDEKTEILRSKLIEDFQSVADGARLALEAK